MIRQSVAHKGVRLGFLVEPYPFTPLFRRETN
jgi:hypothetical protein